MQDVLTHLGWCHARSPPHSTGTMWGDWEELQRVGGPQAAPLNGTGLSDTPVGDL